MRLSIHNIFYMHPLICIILYTLCFIFLIILFIIICDMSILMSQVLVDLPAKSEVILYTGLSTVQKKYYKAILMKDLGGEEDRHRTPCTENLGS